MKLYLVRHGASTGNTPGNLMGQSDHPLTELGEAQARSVAARLAPLGPMPVYCSDLLRARVTAEAIARVWMRVGEASSPDAAAGGASPLAAGTSAAPLVLPDPRLRELHLGDFEDRCWDDFVAHRDLGEAFDVDPYNTALPGGESLALLEKRVLAAVHEIVAAAAPPAKGVAGSTLATGAAAPADDAAAVLVAHDGPIRSIVNHYLGVPPQKWWTLTTTHGGLSLLEWIDGWVNVRFVNDTSHLAGIAAPSGGTPEDAR
jgi:broad specificity phosphatase PhoE